MTPGKMYELDEIAYDEMIPIVNKAVKKGSQPYYSYSLRKNTKKFYKNT